MSKRARLKPRIEPPQADNATDAPPSNLPAPHDGIPPDVWELISQAGQRGAERLLEMLESPAFHSYAPTARKALIELAMTRAYGLPVRRSVEVKLSSDDADAVAASLSSLRDSLPERRPTPRDVTPDGGSPPDDDTGAQ